MLTNHRLHFRRVPWIDSFPVTIMFKQGAFISLLACSRLGPEHITHMTFGISCTRLVSDLRNILQARVRQNVDETSETSHSLFTHWRTEASRV